MTDETIQEQVQPATTIDNSVENGPAVVSGTAIDPQQADTIHAISPSPLGAIEKSKALVEPRARNKTSLMAMVDVPVTLVMEVGRTDISVEQLMELVEGSIVDLRKVSVDSIEVRMNEKIIAQAEAISLQNRYGVRITSLEKMATTEEEVRDGG